MRIGEIKWLLAAAIFLGMPDARADVWTGVTSYEADFTMHRESFQELVLRQMRRALSTYLDSNQDHPDVRRFAEEDRDLILEHLASEVEHSVKALGEYSMEVTADTRAIPKGDSFLVENTNVECGQTVGFNSTWDPVLSGFPIGSGMSLHAGLDFSDVKIEGKPGPVLIDGEKATISADVSGTFSLWFTYSFPPVDGEGFDLLTVAPTDEFPETGQSQVVVASVDDEIVIRVFDDQGEMVAEKRESEVELPVSFRSFHQLFEEGGSDLLENHRERFLRRAIALSSDRMCTVTGEAKSKFKERFEITVDEN